MRVHALLVLAATLVATACPPNPDDAANPDWLKPPAAYQPKTADLTFNEARFGEFNMMSDEDQDKFIEELKAKKGSFKGQAMTKTGAGLTEGFKGFEHGNWELNGITDPILYEITFDYKLYTDKKVGRPIAPNRAVEFTGTLVDIDFQNESKPRKVVLEIACDSLAPIK
jgi:hypothetical protein